MIKRTLACLLIPTFITIANTNNANALSEDNKVLLNIDTNDITVGLTNDNYRNLLEEFEKRKQRNEGIKRKVNERIDAIIERNQKEEQERTERENSYNIIFTISHYGLSSEENGGHEGLTCQNKPLKIGMVANNIIPLGTIIEFESGERVIVADKGGSDFNDSTRLDKFIPTYDDNYLNKLGRYTIKGKIVKE